MIKDQAPDTGGDRPAAAAAVAADAKPAFDPLDMRNYALENLPEMKAGRILEGAKIVGLPLALIVFLFFHLQWTGPIEMFEQQTKVFPPSLCYSATGLFLATLILWLTEAIPNYLTSLIAIVAVLLVGLMRPRAAFAFLGEPVMILNIGSFIMASALVTTGFAKRLALFMVVRMGRNLSMIFWAFILLNMILGAFISATSAKTALLLPVFMVIAAIYGATGGMHRNNVGRNMVLQNLLWNNVSASAYVTGAAANLVAVSLLENAGARVYYTDWLIALLPLAIIQAAISWWTGTRFLLPISHAESKPHIEGGMRHLKDELDKLGPISAGELRAVVIFVLVLGLWATDKLHGIHAATIVMGGASLVLLPSFLRLPALGVMKWGDADIPWHMLMFSWGAYVVGGMVDQTNIVGLMVERVFEIWGTDHAKWLIFFVVSGVFGYTTLISESKTARTIIMFPIVIAIAKKFEWDLIGFCLPMAFMINQVYVLYFNSKPANISYLSNQYSMWESFKFGFAQLTIIWLVLIPWTQYVMPLMGFKSKLW